MPSAKEMGNVMFAARNNLTKGVWSKLLLLSVALPLAVCNRFRPADSLVDDAGGGAQAFASQA